MLFAVDLHKDFVNEKRITETSVLSLQPPGVYSSEFNAPESDGFAANSDSSLGE